MSRGIAVRLSTSSNMTAAFHAFVIAYADCLFVDRLHVDRRVVFLKHVVAHLSVVRDVHEVFMGLLL